jgi:RNA polymerase sigma-70 factor (ECF subfamily)
MAQRLVRAKGKIRDAGIPHPGTRGVGPAEAIRLGRLLRQLMPEEPEVIGLLALMLPLGPSSGTFLATRIGQSSA